MTPIVIFIIAVVLFQAAVLAACYWYKKDLRFFAPSAQHTQVLMDLLEVRNHMRTTNVYAKALLEKPSAKLSFAETEFLHQMTEESQAAISKLSKLVDPGMPLSLGSALEAEDASAIDAARSFNPPAGTTPHYLQQNQNTKQKGRS